MKITSLSRTFLMLLIALTALSPFAVFAAQSSLMVAHPDWGTSPYGLSLKELERQFQEEHPEVDLEAVTLNDPGGSTGGEGLFIRIAAGLIPDVVMMADTTLGELASLGALTDLTSYRQRDNIPDNRFWPAGWNAVTVKGRTYGLPFVTDSRALIYNKDRLAMAGVAEIPTNLDSFDSLMAKLTTKNADGVITHMGFWPEAGNWWLWGWGWLFGGRFMNADLTQITANDPHIVSALEYEVSYAQRYGTPTRSYSLEDGTYTAMVHVSTAFAGLRQTAPDVEFGVSPIPSPAHSQSCTWSGVWTHAVPNGAQNVELAWEYLKYMSDTHAQRYFSVQTTSVPTHAAAAGLVARDLMAEYGPEVRTFIDIMPFSHTRPLSPITNKYWNVLQEYRQKAYRLELTPSQALDEVTRMLQSELDQILK